MTKFYSTICIDVSHGDVVEADSVEEAVDMAWSEYEKVSPSLCHQCASELDMGEAYRLILSTDDKEVYDDGAADKLAKTLLCQRDRLLSLIKLIAPEMRGLALLSPDAKSLARMIDALIAEIEATK